MGQKTHPNGLRVGLYRKWASSWYGSSQNRSQIAINSKTSATQTFLSQGTIAARGGVYFSGREDFVENLVKRYSLTKFSNSRRVLLVDFRFYKGLGGSTYGFLIYTKLLGRR